MANRENSRVVNLDKNILFSWAIMFALYQIDILKFLKSDLAL